MALQSKKFGYNGSQWGKKTVNEGEKVKVWCCTKTNNASKPMLLLIFDMTKTVIKGKIKIQSTIIFYIENKSFCVCFFPKSVTSFTNLAIKELKSRIF